jgi:uncharacterized membrane protein
MDIKRSGETALEAPLKLIIGEASPISYQVSQSHLNAANHNYNVAVRPESVKHTWDTMAGLLRYILERCENANRTPSP